MPGCCGRDRPLLILLLCWIAHTAHALTRTATTGPHPDAQIFHSPRFPRRRRRDLKFENVLIASDGSLRLCDFGSASTHAGVIADKRDRAEQEDAIARFTTPHFRAPEQVDLYNGQPLDERVDIWALGCMLYGLAWFKHPFQVRATVLSHCKRGCFIVVQAPVSGACSCVFAL